MHHHLQQAKNAADPSVLISPGSFQKRQRLQSPLNIYQDFKIMLFTMLLYFAAQPCQRKKKNTENSCRCSWRPPSFCTHELGGSTELLPVTPLNREVATTTQCILFFYFLFYEEAQKESSLKASNTVKLARERDVEAALAASCDIPRVQPLPRSNVSTAAVSPPWGQREETFSH